ncbi:hypothetical protein HRJ34_15700 [Rhizorhabdus wittichii]|uniref:Uncharacterized protein n=1 Tax=Rhizorhabdus wittichii TaxID=160791 RepID=A0A975CZ69_9SPHN|nr:hypothetical protein [Rhizorhabdus wittichii]QTH19688.1 hypothetical protein HRJ34_15050 [Rhizorhabdus wittichii]QTH19808.1 hypothetical protein HRJ34_15700 [Rhizorhabdus wittichii]
MTTARNRLSTRGIGADNRLAMSYPYTPAYVETILRKLSDERLATITPADFQRYWAVKILPTKIGQELIDAERAARRAKG